MTYRRKPTPSSRWRRPAAVRIVAITAVALAAVAVPVAVGAGESHPVVDPAADRVAASSISPAGAIRAAARPAAGHEDGDHDHTGHAARPVVPGKDDPRRGIVHRGLTPARSGPCLGEYDAGAGQCTHGPDEPPPGRDVARSVSPAGTTATPVRRTAPVAPADAQLAAEAAPAAPAPAAASPTAVPCDGDGASGDRIQVLYVFSDTDRYETYLDSFRTWAAGIDTIYDASAEQTGGERHVRFVTESVGGECRAIVTKVAVSASALADFGATNRELATQGFNRRDRKYVIFADAKVYCGIGSFAGDDRKTDQNRSNFGPSYGRTDSGCWGASTASHELGHNLGAVSNSAPHTSGGGHCVDEYDVMCYSDSPNFPQMQILCANRADNDRLDCNHDDYYSTDPAAGSYLATHWNVADNAFLIPGPAGGGGTPPPGDTTPPSVPGGLAAGSVTATGLRLSWAASTDDTGVATYEVRRDGTTIGTATGTALDVTGLAAQTSYRFTVLARDAAGNASAESAPLAVTTAAVGGTGPAAGAAYLLTNGLTGRVADVYRASSAAGTPVIQYPAHGGTNQQWTFADLGDGTFAITSVNSRLCLDAGGTGGTLRQETCASGAAGQHWTPTPSGTGTTLSPASAPTQVLGLSASTIDGSRILGLRNRSASVARSTVWTLTPA